MSTEAFTAEEERELIRCAQRGDLAARNRLWIAFHSFAVTVARQHARQKGIDADEAEGEAAPAILLAIEGFDVGRNTRFSTYLAERLRGTATAIARYERRTTIFDPEKNYRPGPTVPEHEEDKPAASKFWSPKALEWVKRQRRRNDRLIIKWLWFDVPAKSQADIARRLRISPSAVSQRRIVLMKRIHEKDRNALFSQHLMEQPLNEFPYFSYISDGY